MSTSQPLFAVLLASVAGVAYSIPARSATSFAGVGDKPELSVTIIGEYDDKPGEGYWFIDPNRFVEPQRTSTLKITGKSSKGAAISTCSYDTSSANGGSVEESPWDAIPGVVLGKDFSRVGTTDTASFTVRYPSPMQYKLAVGCEYEDGEKALLETVRTSKLIMQSNNIHVLLSLIMLRMSTK